MADIEDVAQLACVSASTVSRVVNGRTVVAATTRQRVLEAIRQLDYRPNSLGRSLATRRTGTIGLVISDITNPYYPEIVRAVEQAAAAYDLSVLLYDTAEDSNREVQAVRLLADRRVDGIIISASRLSEERIAQLAASDTPMVLINRKPCVGALGAIDVDQEAGIRDAMQHLVDLGHRRIAYIGGPSASQVQQRRLAAFTQACTAYGITPPPRHIRAVAPTLIGGKQAGHSLLHRRVPPCGTEGLPPTAIIAYNDLVAIGVLVAAQEAGIVVPDQLSILGHDDIPLAGMLYPALTTVRQPAREAGEKAVQMLCASLHQTTARQCAPEIVTLLPTLQVRASTAGPATG